MTKRRHATFFKTVSCAEHSGLSAKEAEEFDEQVILLSFLQEVFNVVEINEIIHCKKNDPPDCIVNLDNSRIGFELTELVCEDQLWTESQGIYNGSLPNFPDEYLIKLLKDRIKNKDKKRLKTKDIDKYVLIIYTDEFTLEYSYLHTILSDQDFGLVSRFDEVYLFFSYNPESKSYPAIQLQITKKPDHIP